MRISLPSRWQLRLPRQPALDARLLAGLAVGLLLILAGGPRLGAALRAAPGDVAASRLGANAPEVDLQSVAASRAAALGWHVSARHLDELGRAEAALATRAPPEAAAALRRRARAALAEGLARAPVAGAGWVELAALRLRDGPGEAAGAARAAVLAIETAPVDPAMRWRRLDVALAAYPWVAADDRPLIGIAFREAWAADPARAVALVRAHHGEAAARAALADDPDSLARLDALLAAPAR